MLRRMRPNHASNPKRKQQFATESRLQTGAALVLGLLVLIAIVLRAGVHNVFVPGWWRH